MNKELPDVLVCDNGDKVDMAFKYFRRQPEITRKYQKCEFGTWPRTPASFEAKTVFEEPFADVPDAVIRRIVCSWKGLYGVEKFSATAVVPKRSYSVAVYITVLDDACKVANPADDSEWPAATIVKRGYATIAFNGGELTVATAPDAISLRAWAASMLYDWVKAQPDLEEMTSAVVGAGLLSGRSALWAGTYDWRFAMTCANSFGYGPEYRDLVSLCVPRLLFHTATLGTGKENVERECQCVKDARVAYQLYRMDEMGMVDGRVRDGVAILTAADWQDYLDFGDRHGWNGWQLARPEKSIPPLMTTYDGKINIKTAEEWEHIRRPEIVKYFTDHVYGEAPVEKPDGLTFTVVSSEKVDIEGVSCEKRIMRADWKGPLQDYGFEFYAYIPDSVKKVPSIVFISNRVKEQILLSSVKPYWDVNAAMKRGVAMIAFHYTDIVPDAYDNYSSGAYLCWDKPGVRRPNGWGAITAWAWAASRVMDWIETEPKLDAKRVGVAGHSRCGKTALWAGVRDQRFAMVVPQGSGRTGMLLNHFKTAVPTEPISRIFANFPFWFSPQYGEWCAKEFSTPFDHHHLAACVAPRLLYVENGTGDMAKYGEYWTARLASEGWSLYGLPGLAAESLPDAEKPDNVGYVGYYLREGPHSVDTTDWINMIDFANAHNWGTEI